MIKYIGMMGRKLLRTVMGGLAAFAILAGGAVSAQAAPAIVEKPDMGIYIDGETGTYANVPVIRNSRTLLPLVDILTNLGVPNNREHIRWNGKERSVTVSYDNRTIHLKINSRTILVNGSAMQMDVEPVIYKNRTYIPVAFVSESLGKRVAWDANTRSVLIREESEYEKTKQLLEKVDLAMKSIPKSRTDFSADIRLLSEDANVTAVSTGTVEADRLKKQMYMLMNMKMGSPGAEQPLLHMESFLSGNALHVRQAADGVWNRQEVPMEEIERIFTQGDMADIQFGKVLYAGLKEEPGKAPGEIILRGPVYLSGLVEKTGAGTGSQQFIKKASVEITIDTGSYLAKEVRMTVEGMMKTPGRQIPFAMDMAGIYKNMGDSFSITVPQGLE